MASITGNSGVVSIDGSNIANVRSYTIELTSDTIENTVMSGSNSGRTYVKGLSSFSGSADIYFDATDFSGADLDGLINNDVGSAASVVALVVYPEGVLGQSYGGDIIVTGYSINASFDGMVEASISFQGTGQLTYTA
jgi:predicted secreted protein